MRLMPTESKRRWPPRGVIGFLVRRAIGGHIDPRSTEGRTRLGEAEGWISTACSIFLAAIKGVAGVWVGSISLLADAVNNLADVGSSLVIALSFRWSRRPRDCEHPFGHGRAELIATLVLSVILVLVGLDLMKEGIQRLIQPRPLDVSWWAIGVVLGTILLKIWLARFAGVLARATGAPTLEADAWNHRFDVLSTATVLIALGGARAGWPAVDAWAALFVSVFIILTGLRYARQSINPLVGGAPSPEEVQRVRRVAQSFSDVQHVHDVMIHVYGDTRLVSLHIEVDAERPALEVHDLAEQVEEAVADETGGKVVVHVDPVDRSHPRYAALEQALQSTLSADSRLVEFHDLRVREESGGPEVTVDIVVQVDVLKSVFDSIADRVRKRIQQELPGVATVDVGVEAEYSGEPIQRHRFCC